MSSTIKKTGAFVQVVQEILNPANAIVQNQINSSEVKMLVLLANDEQKLITFEVPEEECTVADLLEMADIQMSQSPKIVLVKEDLKLGINYVVDTSNNNNINNASFKLITNEIPAKNTSRKRRRKKSRVASAIKRQRCDEHLGNALKPIDALSFLNEVKKEVEFSNFEAVSTKLWSSNVKVDGNNYCGQGTNKAVAKQDAAENALKHMYLEKMMQEIEKTGKRQCDQLLDNNDELEVMANESAELTNNNSNQIPWTFIMRFALYKLINEWQNVQLITETNSAEPSVVKEKKIQKKLKKQMIKVPSNYKDYHPTDLLSRMKPNLEFKFTMIQGPLSMVTATVNIDGQIFSSTAKNSKQAKKEVAKAALTKIFNIDFSEEKSME